MKYNADIDMLLSGGETMKIIALYNHKGGVSKTTTTFNLARYMQDQGKKVLVVDADPQCNMTEFLMCNIIEHMDIFIKFSCIQNCTIITFHRI